MTAYDDLPEDGKRRVDKFMKDHENPNLIKELKEIARKLKNEKRKTSRDYIMEHIDWLKSLSPEEMQRRVNDDIIEAMQSEGFPSEELIDELETYYKTDLRGVYDDRSRAGRASVSVTMVLVKKYRNEYLKDLKYCLQDTKNS